jgi:sec-independent protein translocase protein TatB
MFDVGISELMVIAVVALVVIGPERLPKVARTAGLLLGRLQRYVSDVKADINREIQLDELKKLQQQVTDQVTGLQASVTHEMREVESSVNKVIEPLAADATVSPAPTPGMPATATPGLAATGAATEMPKS